MYVAVFIAVYTWITRQNEDDKYKSKRNNGEDILNQNKNNIVFSKFYYQIVIKS